MTAFVVNLLDGEPIRIDLCEPEPLDFPENHSGWSIGHLGSGCAVELDEPLRQLQMSIVPGHHRYLYVRGRYGDLSGPPIGFGRPGLDRWSRRLRYRLLARLRRHPTEPSEAVDLTGQLDRFESHAPGTFAARFDSATVHIGNHILEIFEPEPERRPLEEVSTRAYWMLEAAECGDESELFGQLGVDAELISDWLWPTDAAIREADQKKRFVRAHLALRLAYAEEVLERGEIHPEALKFARRARIVLGGQKKEAPPPAEVSKAMGRLLPKEQWLSLD